MSATGTKPQNPGDSEDVTNLGEQNEKAGLPELQDELAGDPIDQPSQ